MYEVSKAMEWSGKAALASTPLTNMTISGKAVAAIQNVGNFSFAYVILQSRFAEILTHFTGGFTGPDMK